MNETLSPTNFTGQTGRYRIHGGGLRDFFRHRDLGIPFEILGLRGVMICMPRSISNGLALLARTGIPPPE